jgi:hypothetical protein
MKTLLTVFMSAATLMVSQALADKPMTGKMAKFDVAGRILNNRVCEMALFDMNKARRLEDLAHSQGGDPLDALKRGMGKAASDGLGDAYCEQLRIDAGDWDMLLPVEVSKADLDEMKMLGALAGSDCNWDNGKRSTVNKFPAIAAAEKSQVLATRTIELRARNGFSEAIEEAWDEGDELGSTKSELPSLCPKLEELARKFQ